MGGGPRVVVSTAAFHARVRGSVPGLGGLKETKLFLPHPRVKVSIVGSLRDREVACSASDRQGSNFESCVWRTVSTQSSHHPQEVLLAQFSLYVHKGGLKPDSFHFGLFECYRQKIGFIFSKNNSVSPVLASIHPILAYDVPRTENVGLPTKFRFNVGPASQLIADSMPVNRLRRWPNTNPSPVCGFRKHVSFTQCCFNVDSVFDDGQSLKQHWVIVPCFLTAALRG